MKKRDKQTNKQTKREWKRKKERKKRKKEKKEDTKRLRKIPMGERKKECGVQLWGWHTQLKRWSWSVWYVQVWLVSMCVFVCVCLRVCVCVCVTMRLDVRKNSDRKELKGQCKY